MGSAAALLIILLLLFPLQPRAKIKDGIPCGSCHTMHNSQNNLSLTGTAGEALLNSSCIGCHQGENTDPLSEGVPYVFYTSEPEYGFTGTDVSHDTLAGGNFYWVQFDDRKGHNVTGLAPEDQLYGINDEIPGGTTLAAQLACAGESGCHGRGTGSDVGSLAPAHHVDEILPLSGESVAQSYRFLNGVQGIEDSDWEFSVDPDDHNQYKGGTGYDDNGSTSGSITSFCVRCHGYYHGQYSGASGAEGASGNGASPWVRHPTDIDIGAAGYDATEYADYTTYNPIAPVASSKDPLVLVDADVDVRGGGNGIIICLTCHRAHGSPYDAMLRWNYKGWPDSSCNDCDGCQICHSNKN